MLSSVKIRFRPSVVEGKEGTVVFQLICRREVKILTSRFRVFSYEWNSETSSIRFRFQDTQRNMYLRTVQNGIETEYNALLQMADQTRYTGEEIERISLSYKANSLSGSLKSFVERCIDEMRCIGREKTAGNYLISMRRFLVFLKKTDALIDEITHQRVREYEHWLKLRNSPNTISFYLRNLRAIYNKAVDMGLTLQRFPFHKAYTKMERTAKRNVGEIVLADLLKLNLRGSSHLALARDIFLFSFYARGMPFVDVASLKKSNIIDGYIVYKRHKTGQPLAVKIEAHIFLHKNRFFRLPFFRHFQ